MANTPFKIQSPTLSLNGVAIDTSAEGKLVIPGVTRAGTSVAIEVNDTGDQTDTWTGTPVVIDGYSYAVYITGAANGLIGWTAAEYAINQLDGEGYIDGIDIVSGGANYTGEAVTYSKVMWAAPEGTLIDSSSNNGTTWKQIPFSVRCGAGTIESEFGGGGTSIGNLIVESNNNLFSDDSGNFVNFDVSGDGWMRLGTFNNKKLELITDYDGNTNVWEFGTDGVLHLPTGGDIVDSNGDSVLGGGSAFTPLPSWITVVSGTEHLPTINTDYGWSGLGAWTVNATILDGGNGTGPLPFPIEGTSYPFRTTFSILNDTKSVTTVDFVVNDFGADFGIGVFAAGTDPVWAWDGVVGANWANRIGAQYDGSSPGLHGISGGAGFENGPGGGAGYNLPGTGTYRARLTVEPTGPGTVDITLETLDTSDTVLDTISYTETSFFGTDYKIGFASDQDSGTPKVYFKNLTINVNNGADIYTDTLTNGSSTGSGGGVDGLLGDTSFTPTEEGDTAYSLDIGPVYGTVPDNSPVRLRVYDDGLGDMGPGISLGYSIGDKHRSGVVAIGNSDAGYNSKQGGVYIGYEAGWNDREVPQGEYAVAIGAKAARTFAEDNSITLNATGEYLDPTGAGLFIKPIQENTGNTSKALYYNTVTGEITYTDPTGGTIGDDTVWIQTLVTTTPLTDTVQVAISVEYDYDGNIIALFDHTTSGSRYFSVGKFTRTGSQVWTSRLAAGINTDGWGLAVDQGSGYVYVTGTQNDEGVGEYTTSVLFKIDGSNGYLEWSRLYDFGVTSSSAVIDVASDDGNPVMVGYVSDSGGDDSYITTTKVSASDGQIIWTRKINGQADERAFGMAVGPGGEIVVVGYMSDMSPNQSALTLYSVPATNVNWSGGVSGSLGGVEFFVSVSGGVPTFDNIIDGLGDRRVDDDLGTLAGNLFGASTPADNMTIKVGSVSANLMVVVRYLSDGTIDWQKSIQFDAGYNSNGADADIDSNGNIYICGNFDIVDGPREVDTTGISIVKLNNNGDKQWSRRVVGSCIAASTSIVVGPDDRLYLSGVTFNNIIGPTADIVWVAAKYKEDGIVEWQKLIDNTGSQSFAGTFFQGYSGGSNIAVKQGYVALGGGFGTLSGPDLGVHATLVQVTSAGTDFSAGDWDFKDAGFSGTLNSSASDIIVANAGLTESDNISHVSSRYIQPEYDISPFLIGTTYRPPGVAVSASTGFTLLADGSLQANVGVNNISTLTDSLLAGQPTWLTNTPRSPDRSILDTQYGFNSSGMWFTGNNEETLIEQPAYPIHTTDSFPADVKTVVEFDLDLVSGQEDWGVCVYPADGVPHWSWYDHPSRIAATINCGIDVDPYATPEIHGLYSSKYGSGTNDFNKARFTYDPIVELTTLELINVDNQVTSSVQLPGRLAQGQDYMIGFDADWDEAGPGDKSYFSNLTITSGNIGDRIKSTELTITGEVKLPNTNKGFVNLQGPWSNGTDDIEFQSVAAHDGYAYMLGTASWNDNNRLRLDKYSLTSGELVWTKIIGAGRGAQFDISWDVTYSIDNISNGGIGYQAGEQLYIGGDIFSGDFIVNRATITVESVDNQGSIETATIIGTVPGSPGSVTNIIEFRDGDAQGDPTSIKYDTVSDTLVVLTQQWGRIGDANDSQWYTAVIIRINPVSGDVVSSVTLSDDGDINPYDVATHPTTGVTAVVGQKFNEYRSFGTLVMLAKGNGYFDILKSNLDAEHYPGNQLPGEYYNDFWIEGTGIATKENIDFLDRYAGLATTVLEGSGASFNVANNGDGTYSVTSIANNGTNYQVGHKIKVLGTDLTGAENTTVYDAATYGGGFGAWKVTDDGAGNTYLIFPQPANSSVVTTQLAIGDSVSIEWGGQQHATTIAGALGAVPNDPYVGSFPNSQGYLLTDNFGLTGQPDYNVGTITTGNGIYLGLTPANDAIITVTGATNGVIDTVSISGTASGGVGLIEVSGTNYQVGSGCTMTLEVPQGGSVTGVYSFDTAGSNYVVGDVITVAGTQFPTGTSPAEDVTMTVTDNSGGGVGGVNGTTNVLGTVILDSIRILVDGVDFTAPGLWTMKQNLGGEAFVWTPDWHVPIGGPSNDRFQALTYSKDGAYIYAVGNGRYEVDYEQSLVVRYLTSNGDIDWSKTLNSSNNSSYATSVATIGTSDIVVSGYEWVDAPIYQYKQFVARMNDAGTVLWKKYYNSAWPEGISSYSDVQVDSDDNIYVTINYQANTPGSTEYGFHVTKLGQDGNVVWSRCLNGQNAGTDLGDWSGTRWSSLSNDQLVVAGYTYVTADGPYTSGLWASFPTDGFTYLGGEGSFVQQGAFRFSQGSIYTYEDLIPPVGSFTPEAQAPNITATTNAKKYETRTPNDFFEQHLHKMTDPKHGGLVFGDGSRQTFATDKIPQIRADNNYVLTAQDSGKHIYYKNNSGTITIPEEEQLSLPVGFTFTIINRTGNDCYVRLYDTQGPTRGTILGAGRNSDYYEWGIPDSGSGSMVTLIKLESLLISNGGSDIQEPVWMISGPSDIYVNAP